MTRHLMAVSGSVSLSAACGLIVAVRCRLDGDAPAALAEAVVHSMHGRVVLTALGDPRLTSTSVEGVSVVTHHPDTPGEFAFTFPVLFS